MKYNSLDLPAIPSTVYPYSHMTQQTGLVYLHNADKLCYVETGLTKVMKRQADEYFHLYEWVIALTEEDAERDAELYPGLNTSTWTLITENENTNFIAAGTAGPFWTNTDLYDQDGNLFLEASMPYDHMSFWMGVALGLAGKGLPPMAQPTAYLYNGVQLPPLPEWDKETYPYVIYTISGAIASSTPFIAKQGFGVMAFSSAPHLVCDLTWDWNGERLSGWEKVDESGSKMIHGHWYTNHDILNTDGTVYCAAHDEPIPVYLPVTMFEGEVTTVAFEGYGSILDYRTQFESLCGWTVGDTIRVTIDGATEEHTVRVSEISPEAGYGGVIGNEGVRCDYPEYDNGGDWCIGASMRSGLSDNYGQALFNIFTRTAGTYQLKIERIATTNHVPVYE